MVKRYEFKKNAFWNNEGIVEPVMYVVFDYLPEGDIFDFIVMDETPFSARICRYYFHQLLSFLHYIDANGICHRDIKPENIMLSDTFELIVIDFGFAASKSGD